MPTLLKAAFRGILKGFPLVNAIIEARKNKIAKKAIEMSVNEVTKEIESNGVQVPQTDISSDKVNNLPHSYISIFFQLITVAIVLYSFFTKQLTPETVINLLKNIALGF